MVVSAGFLDFAAAFFIFGGILRGFGSCHATLGGCGIPWDKLASYHAIGSHGRTSIEDTFLRGPLSWKLGTLERTGWLQQRRNPGKMRGFKENYREAAFLLGGFMRFVFQLRELVFP